MDAYTSDLLRLLAGSLTSGGALNVGTASVTGNATVAGSLTVTGAITRSGALNGVTIRVKNGNNGTTNCDNFCLSGIGTFVGACLGSRLANGQYTSDCSFVPGPLPVGQQLTCLCATF
jgi:hypothetical protein